MNTLKELMDGLNTVDLTIFPQKNAPGRFVISVKSPTGGRVFLTRVATTELMADGRPKFIWSVGQAMKPKAETAPAKVMA